MKLIVFILSICCMSYGYSQENHSSLKSTTAPETAPARTTVNNTSNAPTIAQITKEIITSNFKYTFVSSKLISASNTDRWKSRLEQHFPQISDLQMTSSTQSVSFVMSNGHTEQELLDVVQWFNFLSYTIL